MDKIKELIRLLNINIMSINKMLKSNLYLVHDFENLLVVDVELNILFKKQIDYGLDFKSQKRFVLDILSKIFKYVDDKKIYDDMKKGCLNVFYVFNENIKEDLIFKILYEELTVYYKWEGVKATKYIKELLYGWLNIIYLI